MTGLILKSLEIENFRGFKHIDINRLGRVNLIVGKNNVGKSSLLEALAIYARKGAPSLLWDLLEARNESSRLRAINRNPQDVQNKVLEIKYLFYGRPEIEDEITRIKIKIGPKGNTDDSLYLELDWYAAQVDEQGLRRLQPLLSREFASADNLVLGLAAKSGKGTENVFRLDRYVDARRTIQPEPTGVRYVFVPANGLDAEVVGAFWDNITLTNLQQQVINALKIVEPRVEGLNLIIAPEQRNERIPVIKIANSDGRIPLRSMGEGMNRMLGIALAISNAADGLLLIDEIESGLHYSVQLEMWRLILQAARRLNVQVFATSHSWDCIEAFQKATLEDKKEEGVLIRLGRIKEDIVATAFDERELGIATRDQIEVR